MFRFCNHMLHTLYSVLSLRGTLKELENLSHLVMTHLSEVFPLESIPGTESHLLRVNCIHISHRTYSTQSFAHKYK